MISPLPQRLQHTRGRTLFRPELAASLTRESIVIKTYTLERSQIIGQLFLPTLYISVLSDVILFLPPSNVFP